MGLYPYKKILPKTNATNYIAPGARLVGDVRLSDNVSVWHNTVIRADVNFISIGKDSNVQDLSMLHVTEKSPLIIGENVTIGHSVTLHGCTIKNNVLIGMGAVILDDVEVGNYSIVAAGSVLPPKKDYPPYSMIMGAPAKVMRSLTQDEINMLDRHFKNYLRYAQEYLNEGH